MASQGVEAVNVGLALHNWHIGFYIEEYQRKGMDRPTYGKWLMDELAAILQRRGLPCSDRRELCRYHRLDLAHPQIVESLTPQLLSRVEAAGSRLRALGEGEAPVPPKPGGVLVDNLSFTHLAELEQIDDPTRRAFYEYECLRGKWSLSELKRQVASLHFDRSALSKNKQGLAWLVRKRTKPTCPAFTITSMCSSS